jgi:hypothetical protein
MLFVSSIHLCEGLIDVKYAKGTGANVDERERLFCVITIALFTMASV